MKRITVVLLISIFLFSCEKKQEPIPGNKSEQAEVGDKSPVQETSQPKQAAVKVTEEVKKPVLTQAELWELYRQARKDGTAAKDNGNMSEAKDSLLKAAEYAQLLDRDDIAAWQLNNAAYYIIIDFKTKTQYEQRMGMINGMPEGNVKKQLITETKTEFKRHIKLLEQSSKLLEKAYDLDSKYNDADRTEKIYSNIKYVDWVTNFVKIND